MKNSRLIEILQNWPPDAEVEVYPAPGRPFDIVSVYSENSTGSLAGPCDDMVVTIDVEPRL